MAIVQVSAIFSHSCRLDSINPMESATHNNNNDWLLKIRWTIRFSFGSSYFFIDLLLKFWNSSLEN